MNRIESDDNIQKVQSNPIDGVGEYFLNNKQGNYNHDII